MARTLEQMLPGERELIGWFDIVYSPDDGGWYADMVWDNTIDCPIYGSAAEARAWARQHGGKREFRN